MSSDKDSSSVLDPDRLKEFSRHRTTDDAQSLAGLALLAEAADTFTRSANLSRDLNQQGRRKGDGSLFRGRPVSVDSGQKQAIRNLGSRGEALHSWSESSAVEPGEGHMGNVGQ